VLVFRSIQYGITTTRQRKITKLGFRAISGNFMRNLFGPIIKNAYAINGADKNIKGLSQKAAEMFPLNNWCNALSVPHPGHCNPVRVKNKQGGVRPCSLGSRAHR